MDNDINIPGESKNEVNTATGGGGRAVVVGGTVDSRYDEGVGARQGVVEGEGVGEGVGAFTGFPLNRAAVRSETHAHTDAGRDKRTDIRTDTRADMRTDIRPDTRKLDIINLKMDREAVSRVLDMYTRLLVHSLSTKTRSVES